VLVSPNVARSFRLTKKLLKILKVAEKLPSRIWIGLTVGPPTHLRWVADILKAARNANRIAQFSTILHLNMDRIVLMKNAATADNVQIKYFHRRQLPACLRSWTQLNFAGKPAVNAWDRLCVGDKCSHMPQRYLEPCRRLRSRCVGGIWEPGFKRLCMTKWRNYLLLDLKPLLWVQNKIQKFCRALSEGTWHLFTIVQSLNLQRKGGEIRSKIESEIVSSAWLWIKSVRDSRDNYAILTPGDLRYQYGMRGRCIRRLILLRLFRIISYLTRFSPGWNPLHDRNKIAGPPAGLKFPM